MMMVRLIEDVGDVRDEQLQRGDYPLGLVTAQQHIQRLLYQYDALLMIIIMLTMMICSGGVSLITTMST